MKKVLFLQSEVTNPYTLYNKMLNESPVYWDVENKIWGIYSYHACQTILNSTVAAIPLQNNDALGKMNEHSKILIQHLARLSNPPQHQAARLAAAQLYNAMKPTQIADILDSLLIDIQTEIDWVEIVCKKLPVISILKAFNFSDTTIELFLRKIERLVKIMLPQKTEQQILEINEVSEAIYKITEQHITTNLLQLIRGSNNDNFKENQLTLYVCNLIGLIIQSYDAGRGILSNALLQLLNHPINVYEKSNIQKVVTETLRYDPPIQNTKRVLTENLIINDQTLKKGDTVVVVLAAANRDSAKFKNPNQFDPNRYNNTEHLTFGAGIHNCVARHYAMQMTVDALHHLFTKYKNIKLLETEIQYEPLVNARLPGIMICMVNR